VRKDDSELFSAKTGAQRQDVSDWIKKTREGKTSRRFKGS